VSAGQGPAARRRLCARSRPPLETAAAAFPLEPLLHAGALCAYCLLVVAAACRDPCLVLLSCAKCYLLLHPVFRLDRGPVWRWQGRRRHVRLTKRCKNPHDRRRGFVTCVKTWGAAGGDGIRGWPRMRIEAGGANQRPDRKIRWLARPLMRTARRLARTRGRRGRPGGSSAARARRAHPARPLYRPHPPARATLHFKRAPASANQPLAPHKTPQRPRSHFAPPRQADGHHAGGTGAGFNPGSVLWPAQGPPWRDLKPPLAAGRARGPEGCLAAADASRSGCDGGQCGRAGAGGQRGARARPQGVRGRCCARFPPPRAAPLPACMRRRSARPRHRQHAVCTAWGLRSRLPRQAPPRLDPRPPHPPAPPPPAAVQFFRRPLAPAATLEARAAVRHAAAPRARHSWAQQPGVSSGRRRAHAPTPPAPPPPRRAACSSGCGNLPRSADCASPRTRAATPSSTSPARRAARRRRPSSCRWGAWVGGGGGWAAAPGHGSGPPH
jgi:hypothetical protein